MPNIGTMLRDEITRLSKRASRAQLQVMKSASTQHRRQIASLRRTVEDVARRLAGLARRSANDVTATAQPPSSKRVRFVAKGLRPLRERLGLSQTELGKLVGVSAQSIYQWERGATRPRTAQVTALAALRGLGKREAQRRLASLIPAKKRARKKT